ncbi:MAG: EAL domain-containing protein [Bacilli bacterium]|jgi:diguanylate cyclase (GGDEF)-like protein|nr:EAL domain-containing protein [Bacilli bacterium]
MQISKEKKRSFVKGDIAFIDTSNYEVIFISPGEGKDNLKDDIGEKCYKSFYDRSTPCDFCPLKKLEELAKDGKKATIEWNYKDAPIPSFCMLSSSLVTFQGREALLTRVKPKEGTSNYLTKVEKDALASLVDVLSDVNVRGDNGIGAFISILTDLYQCDRCFVLLGKKTKSSFYCSEEEKPFYNEELVSEITDYYDSVQEKPKSVNDRWLWTADETPLILPSTQGKERLSKLIDQEQIYLALIRSTFRKKTDGNIFFINPKVAPKADGFLKVVLDLMDFFFIEYKSYEENNGENIYDQMTKARSANSFGQLKEELQQNKPQSLGVVFADVNGLKYTNDNYGHALGDSMLISCAKMLIQVFGLDNVYRIGGDEFVAISLNESVDTFKKKTNQIRKLFSEERGTSASLGTSFWEGNNVDIIKQIASADKEMYDEKNFYYDLIKKNPASQDRISIGSFEKTVDQAMHNGLLKVNLVPRFEEPSGRMFEADSLLHLLYPINNITDPVVFIETMEKIGYAPVVDYFILNEVCAFQKRMLDTYHQTVPIAVNVARSALLDQEPPDQIVRIVDSYNIPHSCIIIQLIHLGRYAIDELTNLSKAINERGFPLALNHFGIGDANISVMAYCHFTEAKLTEYFLPCFDNKEGELVLKSVVELFNQLGCTPIVDRISSQEQIEKALKLGFHYFRGPYLSEAITMEEMEEKYLKK